MKKRTELIIEWTATALAIIGAIFNSFALKHGFYLWVVTNATFMALSIKNKHYGMSLMFLTYLILAVIGILYWK